MSDHKGYRCNSGLNFLHIIKDPATASRMVLITRFLQKETFLFLTFFQLVHFATLTTIVSLSGDLLKAGTHYWVPLVSSQYFSCAYILLTSEFAPWKRLVYSISAQHYRLHEHVIPKCHLTLNSGKWDQDQWGHPGEPGVGSGAEQWAWMSDGVGGNTYFILFSFMHFPDPSSPISPQIWHSMDEFTIKFLHI